MTAAVRPGRTRATVIGAVAIVAAVSLFGGCRSDGREMRDPTSPLPPTTTTTLPPLDPTATITPPGP